MPWPVEPGTQAHDEVDLALAALTLSPSRPPHLLSLQGPITKDG